eukprot:2785585-Heterocapsa_arctica.AAC.1
MEGLVRRSDKRPLYISARGCPQKQLGRPLLILEGSELDLHLKINVFKVEETYGRTARSTATCPS